MVIVIVIVKQYLLASGDSIYPLFFDFIQSGYFFLEV